jgi:type VI secretion system protein VasG
MSLFEDGKRPGAEEVTKAIRPILSRHFKPALLARMTIVPFAPLPRDVLRDIVELKLRQLAGRLEESHRIATTFAPALLDGLVERCTEAETGARNVEHVIRGSLMPAVSRAILEKLSAGERPARLAVALDGAGELTVELSN